jgi:hypothetical protein
LPVIGLHNWKVKEVGFSLEEEVIVVAVVLRLRGTSQISVTKENKCLVICFSLLKLIRCTSHRDSQKAHF